MCTVIVQVDIDSLAGSAGKGVPGATARRIGLDWIGLDSRVNVQVRLGDVLRSAANSEPSAQRSGVLLRPLTTSVIRPVLLRRTPS